MSPLRAAAAGDGAPTPATRLRRLMAGGDTILAPACIDGLTARIVESLGFDIAYLGGYVLGAATCITEPLLTLTELATRRGSSPGRPPCPSSSMPARATASPCLSGGRSRNWSPPGQEIGRAHV